MEEIGEQNSGDLESDEVFIAEFSSSDDENFAFAQRFIAVCVGILLVCSMVYLGSILIGNDGLVSYRPSAQALESQEIYSQLIDFCLLYTSPSPRDRG